MHPDFPLFPHRTGRWYKKVRGKFCYFGKVADDPTARLRWNCGWIKKTLILPMPCSVEASTVTK